MSPPRITPRQQPVARRRADGRPAVRIRENHPLPRETIHIRRRNLPPLRIEKMHIPVAEIIAKHIHDIRLFRRRRSGGAKHIQRRKQKQHEKGERILHGVFCSAARAFTREKIQRHCCKSLDAYEIWTSLPAPRKSKTSHQPSAPSAATTLNSLLTATTTPPLP